MVAACILRPASLQHHSVKLGLVERLTSAAHHGSTMMAVVATGSTGRHGSTMVAIGTTAAHATPIRAPSRQNAPTWHTASPCQHGARHHSDHATPPETLATPLRHAPPVFADAYVRTGSGTFVHKCVLVV